jgi:hypothetical protein
MGANTTRTSVSWQNRGDLRRDKVDGNLLLALFAGNLSFTGAPTVLLTTPSILVRYDNKATLKPRGSPLDTARHGRDPASCPSIGRGLASELNPRGV